MGTQSHIAILHVNGDLDVTTISKLKSRIERLRSEGYSRIFLNMAKVSYIDSAATGYIVTELKRLVKEGGQLALTNVVPQVYKTMLRLRLVSYMPISRLRTNNMPLDKAPLGSPLWRRTFNVDAKQLAEIRKNLSVLFKRLPFTDDEIFDMVLASGEALGNAVDHAPKEGILVSIEAYRDRVFVEVSDCGRGFEVPECLCSLPSDTFSVDEPDQKDTIWVERGRGFALMQLLCDSVSVCPKTVGEGCVVRLVKFFDSELMGKKLGVV